MSYNDLFFVANMMFGAIKQQLEEYFLNFH